jgi:threonine dehydrogenase-like Zn-dependent dehydrogenase
MRAAAVVPSQRPLGDVEHPEHGTLSPGQVVVRVLEVGACGTPRGIASFRCGVPPGEATP